MKHRLFIANPGSPLHAEVTRLTIERRKAIATLRAFMKAEGCSNMFGASPASYLFDFKSMDKVDLRKWTAIKVRTGMRSTTTRFRPRRNSPEGKLLQERVKALPACPSVDTAIEVVPGLHFETPMAFDDTHGYRAFIRYYNGSSGLLVVSVPTPAVNAKQLQAYDRQRKSKKPKSWDINMETALWSPPEWLRQVKEWEALQAIEQDGGEVDHD
nr:hypothetical protein [Stenotrophomonas acidaminiphila]